MRRVFQGCRSFATSAPSRLPGRTNELAGNLLTRRRTYANANAVLFWGSALAIAAGMTLSSTVHADAAALVPPAEEETRGASWNSSMAYTILTPL